MECCAEFRNASLDLIVDGIYGSKTDIEIVLVCRTRIPCVYACCLDACRFCHNFHMDTRHLGNLQGLGFGAGAILFFLEINTAVLAIYVATTSASNDFLCYL